MQKLRQHIPRFANTLLSDYESTGSETLLRHVCDPNARSCHWFAFHRPETLLARVNAPDTLLGCLAEIVPFE